MQPEPQANPLKRIATPAELAAPVWQKPAAQPHAPSAHFSRTAQRSSGVPHRVTSAVREHNRGRHFG